MLYQLNYLPTCPKTKVVTFLSFYNARIYWKIINSQGIVSSMTEICHEIFLAWQFGLCECKFFIPILISNINSHIGHDTAYSKYIHIFLYMLMGYTIVIRFKKMKEFNSLLAPRKWWASIIVMAGLYTKLSSDDRYVHQARRTPQLCPRMFTWSTPLSPHPSFHLSEPLLDSISHFLIWTSLGYSHGSWIVKYISPTWPPPEALSWHWSGILSDQRKFLVHL